MKKIFAKILTLCLSFMLIMAIPASAQSDPPTSFYITKYYNSQSSYTQNNGTISKSKGPLKIETMIYGYGHIGNDGVYLDETRLSPSSGFSMQCEALNMDSNYHFTQWKYTISLKPENGADYTQSLSNGSHTIKIVCWGASNPIIKTVTFNVVD